MDFEYDDMKSHGNKEKHGIDFEEAKLLWGDPMAMVIPANNIDDEIRYALIAMVGGKCFVAIFTMRNNSYRIISVRRCRRNEEQLYGKD